MCPWQVQHLTAGYPERCWSMIMQWMMLLSQCYRTLFIAAAANRLTGIPNATCEVTCCQPAALAQMDMASSSTQCMVCGVTWQSKSPKATSARRDRLPRRVHCLSDWYDARPAWHHDLSSSNFDASYVLSVEFTGMTRSQPTHLNEP